MIPGGQFIYSEVLHAKWPQKYNYVLEASNTNTVYTVGICYKETLKLCIKSARHQWVGLLYWKATKISNLPTLWTEV